MSKSFDDLSDKIKPKVLKLLEILANQHKMNVTVIDTLRTLAEQKANIKKGVSWRLDSRHLPDKDGKSNAIDIAPTCLLKEKNWAPLSPLWKIIGSEAKKLGLTWGGDWQHHPDPGHIEV